jgi:hypothetical protein
MFEIVQENGIARPALGGSKWSVLAAPRTENNPLCPLTTSMDVYENVHAIYFATIFTFPCLRFLIGAMLIFVG